MEESLIMEVWDIFREYIPEKNKDMAAIQYVDFLLGKDIDMSIIESLSGYDSHLDDAIKNVLSEESGDTVEDDLDYNEEDEDY